MAVRIAAIIVTAFLGGQAVAQPALPTFTRQQRELLQAIVTAVDASPGRPEVPDMNWRHHVLRASDGSHYVAFSLTPAPQPVAATIMLYVRLVPSNPQGVTQSPRRSAVQEWLKGSRTDPRLRPQPRGFAVGDMPAMGAGAIGNRGAASVGSAELRIMEMQRERARQRKADDERRRLAALEGGTNSSEPMPFEDFDVAVPVTLPDGSRVIQRALTSGPGAYDLFVGWADLSQRMPDAAIHVIRRTIVLGPAGFSGLSLSSIIVADRLEVRHAPYAPHEQRAHPYAIGATDITAAADVVFTPEERLSVAFQIINPMSTPSGLPNLLVGMRIVRINGLLEEHVATLSPLRYDATTLPPDFDLRKGHPVIAAMSVPLATIPRGEYRLQIVAEDRVAEAVAPAATDFTVVGSLKSLLAEAPPLATRVHPTRFLSQSTVSELLERLTPAAPSAALGAMIDAARSGRFADLLVATRVPDFEEGVRASLTGMALLALANPAAAFEFQRAITLETPPAPVQFLLAASRALSGRDQEAIAGWQAARAAGFAPALVDGVIAESYLRIKDFPRAAAVMPVRPSSRDRAELMTFAATRIAVGREAEAVTVLDDLLAGNPGDLDARWLLVHAVYAQIVNGDSSARDRFLIEAARYVAANGAHRALASAWREALLR